MSEVGETFVRVRANTTGFKQEAEGSVARAGRDLGKVFATAFAVGGIAETIKSVVEGAAEHQAAFAVLGTVTKNAGAANDLYGQSIETLIEKEARLKGFSDEDLASSFGRLVSVTHDSRKAFVDLGEAEDLARFRHIGVAQAALAIAKEEQGAANSLQRYGIAAVKVTTETDQLKTAHDRAVAAGAKFTEQQKEQYKTALAVAAAHDKQASSAATLAQVEQRVGGAAGEFAKTSSGQFARLQQDFHQFEVAIGGQFLGGLASGAEGLGSFITKLTQSGEAARVARAAAHDVGGVLHDVGVVAETVGPPLLAVAKAAEEVAAAVGGPALLTAIVTYKALGIATGIAAAAQAFYDRALLANVGVTVEATAANTALAESYTAAGLASALSAEERGIGSFAGGLRALAVGGGLMGPAVLGVAALAGGIVYLASQEDSWTSANKELASSLGGLTTAEGSLANAQGRLAKQAAQANITDDLKKQIDALTKLADAAQSRAIPRRNQSQPDRDKVAQVEAARAVRDYTKALGEQIAALGKTNPLEAHNLELVGELAQSLHHLPTKAEISLLINNKDPNVALKDIIGAFNLFSANFATDLKRLQAGASGIQRQAIPDKIGGSFVLDPAATASARKAGQDAIKALRDGIATDTTDLAQLKIDMADAVKQGAQAVNGAVQSAKQNFNTIGQDIASSIVAIIDKPLTDAQTRLGVAQDKIAADFDQKTAALQAKTAALTRESSQLGLLSSEKALKDLRTSVFLPGNKQLSADPDKALKQLDALAAKSKNSGALDAFIIQYRQAVITVEQGKIGLRAQSIDAHRAAAETVLQLKGDALKLSQDVAAGQKQAVQRRIADLTDEFNKGAITEQQLEKRLTNVFVAHGITRKKAVAELGVSFADQFAGQQQGLTDQAAASAAGPQRPGSGQEPSIVRPFDTLEASNRQIAGIAKQQRDKQLDESKKQTTLLQKIAGQRAASDFTNSLQHAPGGASKRQKELAGVQG